MKLESRVRPIYLPEEDQHSVLRLGLQGISPDAWILIDDDLSTFVDHKRQMYARYPQKVSLHERGSFAARQEMHQLLLKTLCNQRVPHYELQNGRLSAREHSLSWPLSVESGACPLWEASQWVAEDICLMEARGDEYVLTAASVCSPTNWYLEEKMGKSLDAIHSPVPGYGDGLDVRVRRLFDKMSATKILERFNWSVQRGNELFWREDLAPADETAQTPYYWRVERQTLRRLPKTGAIAFTIRLFLHSFDSLSDYPQFSRNLNKIVAAMPQAMRDYKEVPSIKNGP